MSHFHSILRWHAAWSDLSSGLASRAAQHDLIAVGIFAHSEVWRFAVFGLRFAVAFSASGNDLGCADDDVCDLKGQPCPSVFVFASAVDGDQATCDFEFGDVRVLPRDCCTETGLIESGSAVCIGSPDGVFQFFDMHILKEIS